MTQHLKPPSKKCIVCGRPVPKLTMWYTVWPLSNRGDGFTAAVVEDDLRAIGDCRRHTNLPFILSARRDRHGFITSFTAWDGETYRHGGYFCTGRCAEAQGRASAEHGVRYRWKIGA
jgi:hypothetical protein